MDCPEDDHADVVGDRVADKTLDASAPVVEDVLGTLATHEVAEEATGDAEKDHEEEDQVVDHVEDLVLGRETEAHRDLAEEQEAEELQVAVQHHRREVDQETEGPEQDRDAVLEEQSEAEAEEQVGSQDEKDVEGQELPTGREEGLSPPFLLPVGRLGVVPFCIHCVKEGFSVCAHLFVDDIGCSVFKKFQF